MQPQRSQLIWTIALFLGSATAAQAQIGVYNPPRVNPRPPISPYLNMIRGNNPALNYFGLVRPQMQANQQLMQLQQEVQLGQAAPVLPNLQQPLEATGLVTGHGVSFQNLSHFYGGRGATGGVAGGTGNPTGQPNLNYAPVRPLIAGTLNP